VVRTRGGGGLRPALIDLARMLGVPANGRFRRGIGVRDGRWRQGDERPGHVAVRPGPRRAVDDLGLMPAEDDGEGAERWFRWVPSSNVTPASGAMRGVGGFVGLGGFVVDDVAGIESGHPDGPPHGRGPVGSRARPGLSPVSAADSTACSPDSAPKCVTGTASCAFPTRAPATWPTSAGALSS
jgi:hypothetical protein